MKRILVVEDDLAILRGLKDNLEFESYEVLTAADGERGYAVLKEKKPDLVILDLMLPKMSGYELCRKARGEGVTTPILMLTARGRGDGPGGRPGPGGRRLRDQAVFGARASGPRQGPHPPGRS